MGLSAHLHKSMDKLFHLKNRDTKMAFLYRHLESRREFKVREEENERDSSFYVWAHVPVASKKTLLVFVKKMHTYYIYSGDQPSPGSEEYRERT